MNEKLVISRVNSENLTNEILVNLKQNFPENEDNPSWDLSSIKNFVNNPNNVLLIGDIDSEVVAYLYGYILEKPEKVKHFLIYELSTNPKYQQRGIMRKLIENLLELLKQQGLAEAWVLTNKSNIPATSLYKNTGANPENIDDELYVYKFI